MNMLPKVPLGKVLIERKEKPKFDDLLSGKTPIIKKIGFNDGKIVLRKDGRTRTNMILIMPGDLVLSGINAAKGAIAVYDKDNSCPIAATIHYGSYIPLEKEVNAKFLWYLLRSDFFRNELKQQLPGGIKSELSAKRLLKICVPLPSINEQQKIVTRIKKISCAITNTQELNCQIVNSLLLTFSEVVESIRDNLEKTYQSFSLIDLVDRKRGISYGVVQLGQDFENGIPTLRAGDLQQFSLNTKKIKLIDPYIDSKYQRTRLRGGELLLKIRGGYGDLAVAPENVRGFNVSREIAVIPLLNDVIPEYGMYVLSSRYNQKEMEDKLRGTSYIGLNLKDVRKLKLPVPPIEIQKQLIEYLHDFRNKLNIFISLQTECQEELAALMPSILDITFKGEL